MRRMTRTSTKTPKRRKKMEMMKDIIADMRAFAWNVGSRQYDLWSIWRPDKLPSGVTQAPT
jgi:hypothetical protein